MSESSWTYLEVETNTGQVNKWLDARLAKLLWVTDARALEDKRRAQGASRYNDLLAGFDDTGMQLTRGKRLGRNNLDANSFAVFEDDLHISLAMRHLETAGSFTQYLLNFGIHHQVQVLMHRPGTVNVPMCRIRTTPSVSVDPLQPVLCTMGGGEILEVIRSGNTLRLSGPQKVLFDGVGVVPEADFDGSIKSMNISVVARALEKTIRIGFFM